MNVIHDVNGMPNPSVLARVKKCPHHTIPSLAYTEEDGYILSCHEGHLMFGKDIETAVDYWNRVVSFLNREMVDELTERGAGSKEQSYCVRCQENTQTFTIIDANKNYRAECRICRFDKSRKI